MRIKSQAEPTGLLITGVCVMALVSLLAPSLLLHALGLESVWYWLGRQPGWLRWPVLLALWGCSFVLITGLLMGAAGFAVRLGQAAGNATLIIANGVVAGLTTAFYGGAGLARSAASLAFYPVRVLCEYAWDRAQGAGALLFQRWSEEQELRRLYREEFSGDFASFRAFRRHFYEQEKEAAARETQQAQREQEQQRHQQQQQQQQQGQAKKRDAFVGACRLLGLPECGEFTPEFLKKRYHALIRNVHPDVAGPNELALQVNAAHACIKKRKGWS